MDSATPFQPWAADDSEKNVKTERELAGDAKLHRENVNHPKHTQTASYDKESVVAASCTPGSGSTSAESPGAGAGPVRGSESKMDPGKIASMQQIVENTLSPEGRQRVVHLIEAVEALSGAERLLLYLRLPTGVPPHDPLKQPINPLGSRAELQQTVTWIQTHLEVDPDVSLPKQDVYDEYIAHCMSSNMKPLSTADFGKVMKQVYPSVRPRRLGTRGNSRYCYAGLRKKIKLEVPQLPDLGESSKESTVSSRETERIICDWAEAKLGLKFNNITELSRHLMSGVTMHHAPQGPASSSPPPLTIHGAADEASSRQLMKQLKRKIQTQGTPGRPKKNKCQEAAGESPPSTSYAAHPPPVKRETEPPAEPGYGYQPAYVPYDPRPPYPAYVPPPRAHPPPPPAAAAHEYRGEQYAARDLTLPPDPGPLLPINLSSDASLDLSTERGDWRRRPPAARLPLPGKKLILETYQSERQAGEGRPAPPPPPDRAPRVEYLPKKMRAAEIMGGKLAAARLAQDAPPPAAPPDPPRPPPRPEGAFLEDPKNLTSRSTSTAAALAREERRAASEARAGAATGPDCCGLDGINVRTGVICEERHSEILNRERVISICNIDKHDLDDYLNEGNSQEHEEELLKYFHQREADQAAPRPEDAVAFLEASRDPQDDHSQGKNEKISQLRELLAKNLKSQSGSGAPNVAASRESQPPQENSPERRAAESTISEGTFKPVPEVNGPSLPTRTEMNASKSNSVPTENGTSLPYVNSTPDLISNADVGGPHLYNGNCHNEPQSPTTRTQQYDFVPISEGCHSPGNFQSKSPLGFSQRGNSPSKVNKSVIIGGSLQTSPISHSTAASPFVSPRNTPVPRSRLCSRPIPKLNGRKRRNPLSLGMVDPTTKQFVMPNDQKFLSKTSLCSPSIKYSQPMSAPPSPNIMSQYKNQMFQCTPGMPNGTTSNLCLNFMPTVNGDLAQPLSADPLSSEVSRFFQESQVSYRSGHDTSFRSQSVPLKQGVNNIGLLSYNNTPVGSVPPTPVPHEFCDFGSLADTCDISKAGLNPETLDKIYDAIDSSNDVLNGASQNILNSTDTLSNGCDPMPEQQILSGDQLTYMPTGSELLDRSQYNQTFNNDNADPENVEDFLKRTNSIEFDLSDLVNDKNKYYTSRSVPSTPLPYKRTVPNLQIDPRRSREFASDGYSNMSNGISSKSVPSTPQLAEDRSVFSYSNRDFLINGNSVDVCGSSQLHGNVVDNDRELTSPLHDMLREDILEPLTPAADLLADLDKIDGTPYGVDL